VYQCCLLQDPVRDDARIIPARRLHHPSIAERGPLCVLP
jgi:hypothetical protein